jgi:putative hemolysin
MTAVLLTINTRGSMSKFSAMFLMGMLVIFAACSSPAPDAAPEAPVEETPAVPADTVPVATPAPEAAV